MDGSPPQKADTVLASPPGVRETPAREVVAFPRADGQVGFPTAISTGASRGHSATAYQSPGTPFGHLEADKLTLVRLAETAGRGHGGAEAELAKRAQVGYCP